MELADIARWTPVRLTVERPQPTVDWGDLRGMRFEEPFFGQTIARWAGMEPPRGLVRTGLQELAALDSEPSLDPAGFIFHLSRCGSTLLSRLLGTVPGVVVVSEPEPLNALLEADPELVDPEAQILVLRLLVRALGRIRFGDERRYILKLSSWNIRRFELFRRAFPATPWVWVDREPVEIMASILAGPPGWMQLRQHPRRAEHLFGLDPFEVSAMAPEEFCARALAAMAESVRDAPDAPLLVDYRELPDAIWARAAPHFGLTLAEAEIDRICEEARYYAKDPVRRPFTADRSVKQAVPRTVRDLAEGIVGPVHAELAARRAAQFMRE
ncbi:MAG TPA: hypothetical protein VM689_19625 [Aliidongia sp.]|nr:hypothetical protein [Aliidongia sp.]